ncbi:hypothetical protein SSCG_02261 [Streptomyces clavuligerus]|nr:hypothetical protein SSCG_02261 [Streptomyces clavuligerus]
MLTAVRHPALTAADGILIADTDTQNPDPAAYAALLDAVRAGPLRGTGRAAPRRTRATGCQPGCRAEWDMR